MLVALSAREEKSAGIKTERQTNSLLLFSLIFLAKVVDYLTELLCFQGNLITIAMFYAPYLPAHLKNLSCVVELIRSLNLKTTELNEY